MLSLFVFAKDKKSNYKTLSRDTLIVSQLLKKSRLHEANQPALSVNFARYALKEARKTNFTLGEARTLSQMAVLNLQYHSLITAISYQTQALNLHKKINPSNAESAHAYMFLGYLYGKAKNLKQANLNLEKAISLYTALHLNHGTFLSYKNLGEVNQHMGNSDAALGYFLKAKAIGEMQPLSNDYLDLLKKLGTLYSDIDSNNRALVIFNEGLNKSDQQPTHLRAHLDFLSSSGMVHNRIGNKDSALSYHKLSLSKAVQYAIPEEQARALINIAGVLKNDNAGQSLNHLNRALVIAKEIDNKPLAAEIYRSLSETYQQQNKFKEAILALEAHHNLLQTLIVINKSRESVIVKGNDELERSRASIFQLELTNQHRTFERNVGIFASVFAFFIITMGAYHFYNTRKLNKRLSETNLVKDKLFSVIGHDLRNPIGGITTMLSLMEKRDLDSQVLSKVSMMKKQGELALEILNSLLKWGQTQLQGIQVSPVSFNSKILIEKNISLLYHQAEEKQITITDNSLSEISLYGDADHFDFIIRNLLSNAIKFSFVSGNVQILAKADEQKHEIIFSVKDNGTGISMEQLEKFKVANIEVAYGTEGEKGTGLGLMLCKEFVKANHGKIWVESNQGKGACFYFSFPSQAK